MGMSLSGVGRFVTNPELRELPNQNTHVCEFSLALNERLTIKGEKVDKVCFLDFTIWDKGAEVLSQYCNKGDLIYIASATPRMDTWERDGEKRKKIYYRVNSFELLPNRKNENTDSESKSSDF